MRKSISLFFSLVSILLLTSQCNLWYDGEEDMYNYFSEESRSYFDFEEGSTWVYTDADQDLSDTLTLITRNQYWEGADVGNYQATANYEFLKYTYQKSSDNLHYYVNLQHAQVAEFVLGHKEYKWQFFPGGGQSWEDEAYTYTDTTIYLDTYTLDEIQYPEVMQCSEIAYSKNVSTEIISWDCYIAKNIGLIEVRFTSPEDSCHYKLAEYSIDRSNKNQ